MKQIFHLCQIKSLILQIERMSATDQKLQSPRNRSRIRRAKKYLYMAVRELDAINQKTTIL